MNCDVAVWLKHTSSCPATSLATGELQEDNHDVLFPLYAIWKTMSKTKDLYSFELPKETREFYRSTMLALIDKEVPFLVGGAYAVSTYTGISRHTKDFDLFVLPSDIENTLRVFEKVGFKTDMYFAHWLAKAFSGDNSIDVIFCSGNGVSEVDPTWFARARKDRVLEVEVPICPPEEMIWTKAFIMERERYDGADVNHLLYSLSDKIDWTRLVNLFGPHWHVLLSHLLLFQFVYPSERERIPASVLEELLERSRLERLSPPPTERICRGTLLSRAQYLIDVNEWGFEDARRLPPSSMSSDEISEWTDAIENDGPDAKNKPA